MGTNDTVQYQSIVYRELNIRDKCQLSFVRIGSQKSEELARFSQMQHKETIGYCLCAADTQTRVDHVMTRFLQNYEAGRGKGVCFEQQLHSKLCSQVTGCNLSCHAVLFQFTNLTHTSWRDGEYRRCKADVT